MKTQRQWLNPASSHSDEWIKWGVTREYGYDAEFTLADCSRKVRFSFDIDKPNSKKKSIKKLDKIINALVDLKYQMEEAK